jgi:AGZA family xanthine/uracil permease-like MFS transporter
MAVATLLGFACMVLGPVTGVISPSEAGTLVTIPESLVSLPDFSSVLLHLDIWGALKFAYLPAILTFLFTDLFDSISTFVAVSQKAGMMVDGQPERLKESLEVDAVATLTASFLGTTSGTTFAESIVAVLTGGRTGLTAVVTALCFVPCLFLAPLAEMIPSFATGAVLIVSGALMLQSLKDLDFEDLASFIPAALTTICVGLLFSITQGICIGFISHTVMHVCAGRAREVKPLMYLLATLAVLVLIIQGTN